MFKRLRASIRDGFARAFPMVDPFMMVGPDPGQCAVSASAPPTPTPEAVSDLDDELEAAGAGHPGVRRRHTTLSPPPAEDLAGQGEPVAKVGPKQIALALRETDWSGVSIGDKAILRLAVEALEAAPPTPSWPTEKDRIVKWLEAAIAASAQSEVDHPKGSSTRLFYGAQLVAYENALGAVLRASPGEAKPGTVEHHSV